jgi:PAS domain S-box-containing protein
MKPVYKITLIYIILGTLWIYFSDALIRVLFEGTNLSNYANFQTYKGVFYVLFTGLLLFLLIRGFYKQLEDRMDILVAKSRIENEMLESSRLFESIIANSHDGILLYDSNRTILMASPSAAKLLGYHEADLLGRSIHDFTFEEDLHIGNIEIEELARGDRDNAHFYLRMHHGTGELIWIEALISLFEEDEGVDKKRFIANFRDVTEAIQARKEKQESFDRIQKEVAFKNAILDHSVDLICALDHKGCFVHMNHVVLSKFGYEIQDLIGLSCFEFVIESDRREMIVELVKSRKGEPIHNFESRFIAKNGKIHHLQWSGKWVPNQNLFFVVARDVTDNVENERYQNLKRQVLSFMSSDSAHNSYTSILKTLVQYENMNAAELWLPIMGGTSFFQKSYFCEDHTNTCFDDFKRCFFDKSQDIIGKVFEANDTIILTNLSLEQKFERQNALIDSQIVSMIGCPIKQNGQIVGVIVLYSKIELAPSYQLDDKLSQIFSIWASDIKRRSNDDLFSSVISVAKDTLCVIDFEGNFVWFNPALGRMLCRRNTNFAQSNILDFVCEEYKPQMQSMINDLSEGKSVDRFIHQVKKSSNEMAWISWTGVSIPNERVAVLSGRDISIQKDAQEKLLELNNDLNQRANELELSNRALENFAQIVSHDLQEPLRMITNFLTLMDTNYKTTLDERAKKYIFYSSDAAKRMGGLISELLEYAKIGSIDLPNESVDMNEVVENAIALKKNTILQKNIAVQSANLPVVIGKKALLNQLVRNLLNNAIKFAEKDNPIVKIGMDRTDDKLIFYFSNNGHEIPEEERLSIFKLFQQSGDTPTDNKTGIGLSICKRIIDLHNGNIWVESNEWQGTTIKFTIGTS